MAWREIFEDLQRKNLEEWFAKMNRDDFRINEKGEYVLVKNYPLPNRVVLEKDMRKEEIEKMFSEKHKVKKFKFDF